MFQADLFYIFKWWLVFLLIGLSFLPISTRIFSSFLDKGYIFSKIIGICLISYAIYVFSSIHILKFSFLNIVIVWLLIITIQLFLLRKNKLDFRKSLKIFLTEEVLFFLALLLWSYIKGFSPAIHDLEKFMDFGFINSILRSEYFPPRDIWLTPFSINYYYFGHLFTAVLTKLSNIPSFITFNLMLASIFAFTFSMSFSIGINLIEKIKKYSFKKLFIFGLFFAYVVSFSGNLQTIYAFFKHYDSETPVAIWNLALSISSFPNSYWYPSATRFIYHTIHEFPSYSFVVADLHGHVLDIPVVLTLIALALVLFLNTKRKIPILLISSFFLSIAYMTNAWDGIIYFGLFANILLLQEFINNKNKNLIKKFIYSLLSSLKYIFLILILFYLFTSIFNHSFFPFASGIGLICSPKFLINIKNIGPFLFEQGQCEHTPLWQFFILYGFFIFTITSFVIFLRRKKLLVSDGFVLIISFFSILLIIIPEVFYLKDIYTGYFRANTMFKLSYQAFIMFSLSSIYVFIRIISNFKFQISNFKIISIRFLGFFSFFIVFLVLLAIVSIYPYFAIPSGYGDLKKYHGLDGIKYLKENRSSDYLAINWINQNIKGQPVILEAQGDSYTDYGRISANTGLPTVLGWTVHEWLWRGTYDIPSKRFDDVKNLYETSDLKTSKSIIKKYNIKFVYVGGLEKEKYNISEDKFLDLGKIIFANGETNIYKILGNL